ncbi:unnamed protein product [Mesocestoides corti]|uniref:Secreted protein n=1 Tax=Mesocestoides corti TaxID=53468 RepID=A0A0R3UL22_MESCO|nr:unnamed protein product [Mesocestoides corti]
MRSRRLPSVRSAIVAATRAFGAAAGRAPSGAPHFSQPLFLAVHAKLRSSTASKLTRFHPISKNRILSEYLRIPSFNLWRTVR